MDNSESDAVTGWADWLPAIELHFESLSKALVETQGIGVLS